jgi:hypothetical protein
VYEVKFGQVTPEVHLEGDEREGYRPEVAFEARRHLADDVSVEADAGHAGEAQLSFLLVGSDPDVHP